MQAKEHDERQVKLTKLWSRLRISRVLSIVLLAIVGIRLSPLGLSLKNRAVSMVERRVVHYVLSCTSAVDAAQACCGAVFRQVIIFPALSAKRVR